MIFDVRSPGFMYPMNYYGCWLPPFVIGPRLWRLHQRKFEKLHDDPYFDWMVRHVGEEFGVRLTSKIWL